MDGMALPSAGIQVLSALPGRFRIRVPGLYRNHELEHSLRRGLNGSASRRKVSANVVSATLLVRAPEDTAADTLIDEIVALVQAFAAERGLTLGELETRVSRTPVHLIVTEPRRPDARGRWRKAAPGAEVVLGEEQATLPWHTLQIERVIEDLGVTSAEGLTEVDVAERLARFGRNALPEVPRRSPLAMFLDQFKELPVLLLAGSTVLSMATGGVADGLVILGVIVINGVIGFVTEQTAERTIASLTHDDLPEVEVLRGGGISRVAMTEIVPGDVFQLVSGTIVPADARLLRAVDLTVDESALTGESVPVAKSMGALADPDLPLADRTNMVYRGTLVTGGQGIALVVATGRHTQVGQLQAMVGEVKSPETPMQKQLRDLGERTMVIAAGVCAGVFGLGLLRGQPLGAMLRTAVSLAVAAVPEGLPTVAITTLALGIRKMKSHHILVRRLDAIETLGSVQVLCFDKTGTITENRMRVVRASVGAELVSVDHGRIHDDERELSALARHDLERLLWVGALCSEARLVDGEQGEPSVQGSATEAALVHVAMQAGVDVRSLRERHPTRKLEPRTETRKLMATIHGPNGSSGFLVAVKGSPLEVLDRCRFWLRGSEVLPLTDDTRRGIRRHNERMAGEALRVLGMAYAEHAEQPDASDDNLIWVGLMGLADPPRRGLPELFQNFRRAGVRSVMITGDQSATAYAIAKQIGLAEDGELRTLDSIELENMDPDLLADIAPRIHVFSRVSPRHKLRIVQALQKSGLVVAMTGDGINDCPALKAADIGVAMGGNGAGGVARDVADMILESDNLHGMLTAIEHGRVIHADIKKAVRFILSTNTSEILLTLLSVAAGFGEGMTPLQLLWINLVSDIFPELALAVQAPENDVLDQPPRDPGAKMFSKTELRHLGIEGAVLTAGAMGVYTYGIRRYGLSPQAQTVSFVSLATAQLLHAFSVRSEKASIYGRTRVAPNPYIPLSVGGGIALTLLMQLIPGARRVFGSVALAPLDWVVAGVGALSPLLANEMVKASRHSPRRLLATPDDPPALALPAASAE
jgi:P-type Ca2+ transporter type 2C